MTEDLWGRVLTAAVSIAGAIGGSKMWDRLRSNGLSQRISRIENKTEHLDQQLDTLETKVDGVAGDVAFIRGRFAERDRPGA